MATIDAVLTAIDANLDASRAQAVRPVEHSVDLDRSGLRRRVPARRRLAGRRPGGLGFEAAVRPTAGHPMVVAHAKAARTCRMCCSTAITTCSRRIRWSSGTPPPFEPRSSRPDGKRIVARGASDDKGQLMTFVEACRAFERRAACRAMSPSCSRARRNPARPRCRPFLPPTRPS